MVWTLSGRFADDAEDKPSRDLFWLRIGEYTVGRKDADIVLTGDKSISRAHARIRVTQTAESLAATARGEPCDPAHAALEVRLLQSESAKFGLKVNGADVPKGDAAGVLLRDGDLVRFGQNEPPTELVARRAVRRVLVGGVKKTKTRA